MKNNSTPFLSQVAEYLHQHHADDLKNVCVILPNKRAALFLKKHLSQYFQQATWLPEITSSEEFVLECSGYTKISNIELLFHFYKVYCQLEKPEPFDSFVKWAPMLLQDFNEVDQYMVDTNDLFSYINEARALEVWSPDSPELTDVQKNYLEFWGKLKNYYQHLHAALNQQNLCYPGMSYRYVAENISELFNSRKLDRYSKVIFAGFNAFNKAEETIVKFLKTEDKCTLLWDTDSYYFDDDMQEAGMFLRKHTKRLDQTKFSWKTNQWIEGAKSINLYGVNGDINQTNLAGSLLKDIPSNERIQDVSVVLNEEALLIPMLHSIPENIKHVNVTMGYPLQLTPLQTLWSQLIRLHENAFKFGSKNKAGSFHFKDVLRIFHHPFLKTKATEAAAQTIVKQNWVFLSLKNILSLLEAEEDALWKAVFTPWDNSPQIALKSIKAVAEILNTTWTRAKDGKLKKEYLFKYVQIVNSLEVILTQHAFIQDLKTFRYLFDQLIGKETIDFYGEPLTGLQVMGMLETRNLDFKKVIMLSTNEGVIPAGRTGQSFIPYEIKRKFKLPTHVEKDAVFAYHFYRLLQKCDDIHLIYNTDVDGFATGERSRFITQIIHEVKKRNPLVEISEQNLSVKVTNQDIPEIQIEKTDDVIGLIKNHLENGLSPSALNTFIRCPLDYYYKYVLRIKESDEVEENIEASTLGTVVHKTLEALYLDYVDNIITEEIVNSMMPKVKDNVDAIFNAEGFSKNELAYGKNNLTYNVAIKFVHNFLNQEIAFLKKLQKKNQLLTLIALEEEINTELLLGTLKVKLKGNADRIDKIGDTYRVIDYKTGLVKPQDLNVPDMDELFSDPKYSKALQLMLYGMMFAESKEDERKSIQPGIISFRKLSEWSMPVKINKMSFSEDQLEEFKVALNLKLNELLNQDHPFKHDPNSTYCNFCDI